MPKLGTINIKNESPSVAVIDIEGIIGIPEWWQFEDPADRVATYNKFTRKCAEIKDLKATHITVNIRSLGGSTNDAFLIHDALCLLNAEITTACYSYTASAATIIHQSGKIRKISSNALYLAHESMTRAQGNIQDFKSAIETLEVTNERIINLYATRSGKDPEHFRAILSKNQGKGAWISPDEAVENGFADEIVKVSGTVNMDMDLLNQFGYPTIPENLIPQPVTNQSQINFMTKITNSFKAIWDFFKLPENVAEHEVSTEDLQNLNTELENRATTIQNLTTERDQLKTVASVKEERIRELENQVQDLQGKDGAQTGEPVKETDSPAAFQAGDVIASAKELYEDLKDL